MKKKLFTLMFALVAIATTGRAQVVLNETNFPDANFRAALATWLGISEGDEITEAIIAATTTLNVSKPWDTYTPAEEKTIYPIARPRCDSDDGASASCFKRRELPRCEFPCGVG